MRVFLVLLALACCQCSVKMDCRTDGQACAETSDCCDELACFNGTCSAPLACPDAAPVDCGAALPGLCCPSDAPVCCAKDSSCHAKASDCTGGPACVGKDCQTSAGCCAGATCSRARKTCQTARALPIGDACTDSAQCASKICAFGYCTKTCLTSTDCGTGNACLVVNGNFRCVPTCQLTAQCGIYASGLTCDYAPDLNGKDIKGCIRK